LGGNLGRMVGNTLPVEDRNSLRQRAGRNIRAPEAAGSTVVEDHNRSRNNRADSGRAVLLLAPTIRQWPLRPERYQDKFAWQVPRPAYKLLHLKDRFGVNKAAPLLARPKRPAPSMQGGSRSSPSSK